MILWQFIATFFYIGKLPFAPGTWGSLSALVLWYFLPTSVLIHCSIIITLFIVGVYSSNEVVKEMSISDPPEVIIDEVTGMGISLFLLPHDFRLYIIAFIVFRIFDILKPTFIYRVQSLPGGWGIMIDDVLAGMFTFALVNGLASII